jgi:hypothetical protein
MEFITLELTKKLKEKGFDYKRVSLYDRHKCVNTNYATPTIAQVLKWLREEKRIDAGAIWSNNDKVWVGYVNEMDMPDLVSDCVLPHNSYDSYEKAAISAVEYVLDNNLI